MCLFRFTIFVRFCVSLDHFIPALLDFVVLGLVFLQYKAKRQAGKNVFEITYSVSSGCKTLTQSI